jgi:hypothetical protein
MNTVFKSPPKVALIVAFTWELTLDVLTVNAAEVFPAGMVTDDGTVA